MSLLAEQIKKCMSDLIEGEGGKVIAHFCFPEEFIGFQGHFLDTPILPGVCEIQAVMVILEIFHKRKPRLKEIILAKFFSPVSHGEELIFECQESREKGDDTFVKTSVMSNGKKIAELQLRVSFEDEEKIHN